MSSLGFRSFPKYTQNKPPKKEEPQHEPITPSANAIVITRKGSNRELVIKFTGIGLNKLNESQRVAENFK